MTKVKIRGTTGGMNGGTKCAHDEAIYGKQGLFEGKQMLYRHKKRSSKKT